jgi:acyl-CoA synthetase (AMP-forming)/AMP-acid ligase II
MPTESLWAPLDRTVTRDDLLLIWDGDGYTSWSWDHWRDRSMRFAAGLRRLGVQRGDRVACLMTNSPGACAAPLGAWLGGACLVSLPLMPRGMDPHRYLDLIRRIVGRAAPVLLVCDREFAPLLSGAELDISVASFDDVDASRPLEPDPLAADDPACVQYSSGSTSEPRGCVLTGGAIAHQLATLARALAIDPERDSGVVWLPLSHDMGLFGCLLLTYWTGHRVAIGTPQRFLTQPGTWFEDCARFGATVSAAPNFALDVAARVATARMPSPFPMRRLVIGGERVEAATLRRAVDVLGPDRLDWRALVPAYGLAEAVLAVTMTPIDEGPTVVEHDAAAAPLVSAGPPLPGVELSVDGDGDVGDIVVHSPSLAEGYLDDPAATAERFTADGLRTGDLGFLRDGHLYVTGRVDDLLCVAGRNLYARDIEVSLAAVPGVRPGGCAVVDVDGGAAPRLVAVVEPRADHPDFAVMAEQLGAATRAAAGVMLDECVFVERGQLPKTPSGKVQRFRCRELAADGGGSVRLRP